LTEGNGQAVSAEPPARGVRWTFRAGDLSDLANPDDAAAMRRAAKTLGVSEDLLRAAAKAVRQPEIVLDRVADFKVVRGEVESEMRESTRPAALIPKLGGVRRVDWADMEELACAHLELEGDARPDDLIREAGPDAGWVAAGKLYLLYCEDEGIPARERAAAALALVGAAEAPGVASASLRRSFVPPVGGDFRAAYSPLGSLARWAERPDVVEVVAEDPRVDEWLRARGLVGQERYPHALCPISPSQYSGRDPVVVLEKGIWCFRCDGRLGDGWRSWGQLVAQETVPGEPHPWVAAAREWVHWEHAERTLPRSGLSPEARRWAYAGLLRACHRRLGEENPAARDELLAQVFNPHLGWVRGDSGRWLHAATLEPIDLKDPELACLPWVRGKRELVAMARAPFPLAGFAPVRPVDTVLDPASLPPGTVPLSRPRPWPTPPPLDPSIDPLSFEEAVAVLSADFPGVCVEYLLLVLVAAACSERGGPATILVAAGPSGAGKTQTIYLANSIIEARAADATDAFPGTEEVWRRRVGEALTSGHRPIVVNDVHRVRGLHLQIKSLIGLEDPLEYRPLFSSATRVRIRSPFLLTCVTLPRALGAPEMARRIRVYRLPARIYAGEEWRERQARPAEWRSTPTEDEAMGLAPPAEWLRVRAAEGILAEAIRVARAHDYRWGPAAASLGAAAGESADPEQDQIDEGLLREVFEHVCGRSGEPSHALARLSRLGRPRVARRDYRARRADAGPRPRRGPEARPQPDPDGDRLE
jgi:hypothetical protein